MLLLQSLLPRSDEQKKDIMQNIDTIMKVTLLTEDVEKHRQHMPLPKYNHRWPAVLSRDLDP